MGEMAEVKLQDISYQSGSNFSVELDAEPIPPRPYGEDFSPRNYGEGISYNLYSNDVSADAIAGVPPRNIPHSGSAERRAVPSPQSSPLPPRQTPIPRQPVQNPDTEQQVKKSFGSSVQHDDISVRNSRPQQVPSEKDMRNDSDFDSSYGSSFGSMESCSSLASNWEDELLLYRDKMPTEIKEDYYDAMILYTETDYEMAEAFRQHLINDIELPFNEKCRALLYDSPELMGLSGSKIQNLDLSMERCTYVFVYMTADFVRDKWCEFSSESCLMRAIYDEERRWCVVPIYTERRTDCKFKIPMGLNSLKGINYYCNDDFYRRGVSRLIGDKIYHRLRLQKLHKIKQKRWLENHKREVIKSEEQNKRIATQEEKLTREFLRKISYLPDSEVFPNQYSKMHNSYSESQLSSKDYSFPHSASSGSLKPIIPQNSAVALMLEAYKHLGNATHTSSSPTPELLHLLFSRNLEQDGSRLSPPDPLSDKFQALHLGSQNSGVSADIGVRSETSAVPGEVELNISPENLAYLQSLPGGEQQKYLESLLASQDEPQQYQNLPGLVANQHGILASKTGPHTNGVPNFDLLSVNSQQPSMTGQQLSHASHVTQQSDDSNYSSSYSSGSIDDSARPEISHPQRIPGHSQGNLPTQLFEDSGSIVSEDSGSLGEQGDDWTIVDHQQVPKVRGERQGKSKTGRKNKKNSGKDIEMVETTNKKGNVIHQTIYHIYGPKAVQIGDENVVQDLKLKTTEDENDADVDTETEVKGQSQASKNNEKETGKGKESGSDEEDSQGNNLSPSRTSTEQIHGEINDVQHNSVGTVVAMDAALSSAGSSFSHRDNEVTITGQEDFKHNLPVPKVEPDVKEDSKIYPRVSTVTGRVKPAIPVKPFLPIKPQQDKHTNDTDQTHVKPIVCLPVRDQDPPVDDASSETKTSPRIMKKIFEKPTACVGPCVRNDNVDENTDPKTVIQSEETAVKCPAASNIIHGEIHTETEPASFGDDSDETLVKPAHTTSQKTLHKTSVERPKRSIQSLMPLQALEMSGQADKSNNENCNNCKKGESGNRQLFQAPPFSMSRHSDAATLFYNKYRHGVKQQTDQFENSLDSLDETVAVDSLNLSDPNDADSVRQRSITRQPVRLGEDPLSRMQETTEITDTMGFIPTSDSDLDTNDIEYDFMEDSVDEMVSSSESQTSQRSRRGKLVDRLFSSLKGKPT